MPHVPFSADHILAAKAAQHQRHAPIDYTPTASDLAPGVTFHLRPLTDREWHYYKGAAARQPESIYPLMLLATQFGWEASTIPQPPAAGTGGNGALKPTRDVMERRPYPGFPSIVAVPETTVEVLAFEDIVGMAMAIINATNPTPEELAAASFTAPSTPAPPASRGVEEGSTGATGATNAAPDGPSKSPTSPGEDGTAKATAAEEEREAITP